MSNIWDKIKMWNVGLKLKNKIYGQQYPGVSPEGRKYILPWT